MKLSVNLDTHIVTPSPSPLRIKAGSKIPCEVSFTRNSRMVGLDAPVIEFAVKPTGAFDTDLLIFHNAFESAANNTYLATINSDTVNLRNALGLGDDNTATDKPQIDGSGEVAWTVAGETFRSATFPVTIEAPIANSASQPLPAAPVYPAPDGLEIVARKGQIDGYAGLDGSGKVPQDQLPTDALVQSVNGQTGHVSLTKSSIGLGNVNNTADLDKPVSNATQSALQSIMNAMDSMDRGMVMQGNELPLKLDGSLLGAANGVAPLGADAKVPHDFLPQSILGATKFQGVWNAATDQPAIPAASQDNLGWYFIVTTEGATSVNGIGDWKLGDWILSIGTSWVKVDNTDAVITVNGKTGIVTLTKADVGLGNVDNTADADKPVSTAQAAAIANHNGNANAHGQTSFSRFLVQANGAADVFSALGIGYQGRVLVATPWPTGTLLWADSGTWSSILLTAFSRAMLAAADAAAGRSLLGLSNVDNTSDVNKPISTAQATALASKVGTDGTVQNVVSLTQAQYTALSPKVATTLYVIVG